MDSNSHDDDTIYHFDIGTDNWYCIECGTKEITMIMVRVSEYIVIEEGEEDSFFQIPKYFISQPPLLWGDRGKCYCSNGCFMRNPRSKL
jgi:hypothetical protein